MSRRWLLFLFCLSLLSLVAPLSRASLSVQVDDASIKLWFDDQGTRVVIPIENALPQPVAARVKLVLLDTDGATRAASGQDYQLKSGRNELTIPLALRLTGKAATNPAELLWYRLRYEITPAASSEFDTVSKVVSLSEITPDIFKLNVATSLKAHEGSSYRLRVSTAHALNSKPVAGVAISAELKFNGYDRDDIVLKQSARTDRAGFATLDFQIPRDVEDDDGDLTVTGQRGILAISAESEVEINRETQIMVTSDKPLYQPGQMLHLRVLMFDSSRRALADQKVSLKVLDPETSTTFRAQLTSSRFGVASADWQIPENARLGDYRVEVELDSDKYEDAGGSLTVKISRYDLPNFTVNVKPDRPFYLSGQNAGVEVRADYLFGQPVKRGRVRVVRETERTWNFREQRYETEEGDKYEGETDAAGKFVAHIKLADAHARLGNQDYSRYEDLTYAAYFTDPTTNRTEQRRFDLRLTKNAIHVYPILSGSRQARDLPLDFYVSTSYADGTPASCEVSISRVWNEDERQPAVSLRTIKTNRFGLAKVSALRLPNSDDDESEAQLLFRARDDRAATGKHVESLDLSDRTIVLVTTDKPLYRDGESIRAQIVSNTPDLTLALDAIGEEKVVQSKLVTLKSGRASVEIPFRREFAGTVTIAAYAPSETDNEDEAVYHTRTVLYPHDRDLRLDLSLDQESYRPGQDAVAKFLTRSATGSSAESALGVVIFDRAVEERARTDRDVGGSNFYGPYRYLSNDFGAIGGVGRRDLERLDLSKPLPEGIDLVAEVLLTNVRFAPRFFHSKGPESNAATIFRDFMHYQFNPLKERLEIEYKENCSYPNSEQSLRDFALFAGISFADLRDPWAMPYRTEFFAYRASDVLSTSSAGPDKQFDTADDFTVMRIERPYFRFTGEAINRAVARYHTRTGKFIRDAATLKNELRQEAIEFDSLRDPWGEPYRLEFGVSQTRFQVIVTSSGHDRRFATKSNDDVPLWTSSIDYATALQARMNAALIAYFDKTARLPQSDADFKAALQQSGFTGDDLLDPWGNPYYATFSQTSVYTDRVNVYNYATYGQKPLQKIDLKPVTQLLHYIYLRSPGADAQVGTYDDFNVATFTRLATEQAGNDSVPEPQKRPLILPGSTGAVTGTVIDPQGAAIARAKIAAKNERTTIEYTAETSDDGTYIIQNLSAGFYEVVFDAAGFNRTVITQVAVRSSNVTQLNVTLDVGAVSETVNVTGGNESVNFSTDASVTSRQIESLPLNTRTANFLLLAPGASGQQLSTPRLREYFPETLVWQPSLETDKQGRAQLQFKLADNITTWKMSVIGSTEDGQVGVVEREIKSFQPFFVEHDPPRVLTEGDEIFLPIVVRNYLDRAQTVNLEIKPEGWFTLLGGATRKVDVAAGDAMRSTFDFRASASVVDGKQRITAMASDANDAIEKPVTVHPDGEEKSVTSSDTVSNEATLTLDIPATAIPNSAKAELKIYPNLLAHVTESVEAIMARPYGCGEQTISSTYPSLLWLKNYKRIGGTQASRPPSQFGNATRPPTQEKEAGGTPAYRKAMRYLRAGYARLLNYRDESGGFTYWGRGEPDLALTAYALRFLAEASEVIEVDDDVIKDARNWLIKKQQADGSWAADAYGNKTKDQGRTAMLTAFVARVLAMTAETVKIDGTSNKTSQQPFKVVGPELKRALDYLALRTAEIDEPYLLASYALASLEVADIARAEKAIARLRALALEENGANYWSLETNTPFYGWGRAGRVETTALVVQALTRAPDATPPSQSDQLIDRGLLFLLREKDRYGVWYSTQATINVLDTLLALLARDVNAPHASRIAQIVVNGRAVKSIELPVANQLVSPISVDLSSFIQAGINRVEIKRAPGSSPASAQAVATYYLPWRDSVATQEANWRANGASGLRLVTKFDKTSAKATDEIDCRVEAERIGSRGYGMMLAEIGLPPGADVDRASLETAMKASDGGISQYDVLPDRVILYLWPRAGGTKFNFKFKPRFGINAQSAASIVYDYYNPEARAIVAPARFVVK